MLIKIERIERIDPYRYRKDGEYQPYYEFLKESLELLDIKIPDAKIEEQKKDIAYDSLTTITKFGTQEYGLEIYRRIEYKQVAQEIAADIVRISSYGIDEGSFNIRSIRENINQFLELTIKSQNEKIKAIITKFYETFQQKHIDDEDLKNEILILKTLLKRKSWSIVELRAKENLERHKNNLFLKFSYALSLAAQEELAKSEEILEEIINEKLDFTLASYNLALIKIKQGKKEIALDLLLKILKKEPEFHGAYWYTGQIYDSMGINKKAIDCYHNAIRFSPNIENYSFLENDHTAKAKQRIRELKEFE